MRSSRSFWLMASLSALGYLVLLLWMPLAPHAAPTPRPDVSAFAPWPWGTLAYTALLAGLLYAYWRAYRLIVTGQARPSLAAIMLPAALFCAFLVAAFPINALDIYNYLILGRLEAVFGQNPYLVAPAGIPHDPFLKYAGEWGKDVSNYGPVFHHVARWLAGISRDNLLLGLLLFKGLAALVFLASAGLIWLVLRGQPPQVRAARTLLWAWNPALLLIFAMDGHNDGLMLIWLLLGLLFLRRGQAALGFTLMALAPLTKFSGVLPIPFLLLAALRALPDLRARLRLLLLTALGTAAVTWLVFLPYGSPLVLMQRLARSATGAGYSPLTIVLLAAQHAGWPLTRGQLATAGVALFALICLGLLVRTWRGRSPLRAAADSTAAYLALSLSFRIWYPAWVLPWVLLDAPQNDPAAQRSSARRLAAGNWFLLAAQFSVLVYGQLRVALLHGDRYLAHLLGVPLVFILPLVLAWLGVAPTPPVDSHTSNAEQTDD